nr:linoleate 13S-lipoxygenase 3-1, chloroplastic [Tanacetum cinerariifolium]
FRWGFRCGGIKELGSLFLFKEDSVIGAHKSHVIDGPEDPPPKHLEKKRSGKTKPAVVYNYGYKRWRFVLEGLPADLIRRGMAVPGLSQRYRLKLLIKD